MVNYFNTNVSVDDKIDLIYREKDAKNWEYEIDNHTTANPDAAEAQRIFTATFEAEIIPEEARILLDGFKTDKVWHNAHIRDHQVYLNGVQITGFVPGDYLDHYIYEADLSGLIQKGKNEVRIVSSTFYFEPAMVHHPVIITGRFAVAGRRHLRISAELGQIETGPWDRQGYPYYSGVATYRQQFHLTAAQEKARLHLEMEQPGDLAEVIVNGISCGARAWEPFAWDISEVVTSGQNNLQIKVANSLQNLLLQELKPSGLLGTVRIVPYKQIKFELS